jgi:hypothetical protein
VLASTQVAVNLAFFGIFPDGHSWDCAGYRGMALLFSWLIYLLPFAGKRPRPRESFEDSQQRIHRHLAEMRRDRRDT